MDIITGYLGEPHVTSDQDRDINIGIVGDGSYVMPTGQRIAAEVSNNNEIRIRDGLIIHQGCAASIKKNTYDSVTITNGSQGMKRIDLIVARYQREVETNKETITLVVIQGTPAESDPAVPEHIEGDIQAGDSVADMPLYQVVIDGLNITEVKKVFEEITSLKELNSNIPIIKVQNGTSISFVPDHDCCALVSYEGDGWGYDGSTWQIEVNATSGNPSKTAYKRAVFDGHNTKYSYARGWSFFQNLKAGTTYKFERSTYFGSVGAEANACMTIQTTMF